MTTGAPKPLPPFFWPVGEGSEPESARPPTAIGHDGGRWLYVDDTKTVRATSLSDEDPLFVNSTDTLFVACMTVFADEWNQRASLADDEADAQTERLHQALHELDPDVPAAPNAWWALILEQLRDGLL